MKKCARKMMMSLMVLLIGLMWGANSYGRVDNEDAGNVAPVTAAASAERPAAVVTAEAAVPVKEEATPVKEEAVKVKEDTVKAEEPAAPAAPKAASAPAAPSVTAIQPDREGVIKNLPFTGDIVDFLRMLGAGCQKNIIPSSQVRGSIRIELFDVTFREALDAVLKVNGYAYEEEGPFVYVYTQKEYDIRQAAKRKMESRVFKLNYTPAADMAVLIKPMVSKGAQVTTSPEAPVMTGDKKVMSGENWAVGNYIIVVDYPEQLTAIESLIAETDRRPAQVLVEATILVADVSDTDELGIDLSFAGGIPVVEAEGKTTYPITSDAGTDSDIETKFAANVQTGGLSLALTSNNVGVLIRALESITDVVTLGNPKILTLNRQPGKVIVGNRDGYITTEVSQTTTTQTVEFLETGTQLVFRPFVMDDGYIRMELNPRDSDGGVKELGGFVLPAEKTAEVTSNVLVKDGNTIVIGGLFRDKTTMSRSQIPFLGEIPVLGALFRSTSDTNEKEEVIFLITPHIVQESIDYAAADKAMADAERMSLGAREGMQWHSREKLAMYHYNLAKERQDAGNTESALWNANMARELSPVFLDAQRLRDELLQKQSSVGEVGSMHSFMRVLLEKEAK